MKTPEALQDALKETFTDEDEYEQTKQMCQNWFKYGEYITLEIDTVKETCIVLENFE